MDGENHHLFLKAIYSRVHPWVESPSPADEQPGQAAKRSADGAVAHESAGVGGWRRLLARAMVFGGRGTWISASALRAACVDFSPSICCVKMFFSSPVKCGRGCGEEGVEERGGRRVRGVHPRENSLQKHPCYLQGVNNTEFEHLPSIISCFRRQYFPPSPIKRSAGGHALALARERRGRERGRRIPASMISSISSSVASGFTT